MFQSAHLISTGVLALAVLGTACEPRKTAVQPSATTTTSYGESTTAPPAASAVARDGVVPSGSALTVRTVDRVSTESAKVGSVFQAVLASPIRDASGAEIVPEGTRVYGRVVDASGGGAIKRPRLEVTLSSIETPSRRVSIATNSAGAEGGTGGAVKKVGAATLIGAAAGSAGAGAAVGGAVVLLQGGKQISIEPGTLIEFTLTQPAQVK